MHEFFARLTDALSDVFNDYMRNYYIQYLKSESVRRAEICAFVGDKTMYLPSAGTTKYFWWETKKGAEFGTFP